MLLPPIYTLCRLRLPFKDKSTTQPCLWTHNTGQRDFNNRFAVSVYLCLLDRQGFPPQSGCRNARPKHRVLCQGRTMSTFSSLPHNSQRSHCSHLLQTHRDQLELVTQGHTMSTTHTHSCLLAPAYPRQWEARGLPQTKPG